MTEEEIRTLPIAIRPISKKKIILRKEKNNPKHVRPSPISDKDITHALPTNYYLGYIVHNTLSLIILLS
jgi:hypothetical protein